MSEIYIPNSIALRNFDSIFHRNSYDFSDKSVSISFHPSYVAMHPIGLCFYAALSDYIRQNGISVSASIDKKIPSIPYLQRMGLFKCFGFKDPNTIIEHEESGRFIPLTKIRNSDELAAFIKNIDPILHTIVDPIVKTDNWKYMVDHAA